MTIEYYTGAYCRRREMDIRVARQPFLAVFLFTLANGLGALPALIAAQRFFAASAIALRAATLSLCFRSTTGGDGALPALTAAQRFRAASAIAFRPAALILRLRRAEAAAETAEVGALGGRPPRRTELCRA